ncbi:MAG: hypothetical protein M3544_06725 [Pseudomonadota bacterium]|jgi:hypothetical protein|nr:hypothetical protein [Pseudomonadota bacterium]
MRNSDVPRRALQRAVELCGGIDALGDALNVTGEILQRWLSGEEEPPLPVFTQAVGLILEATAQQRAKRSDPSEGGRTDKRRRH